MPLSEDFNNSRLEYLQNALKNSQVVTQQFYPRFQRRYNDDFPFTEASIQNILQPQQQIIKESIPAPTADSIEMDLKQKLNTLTKDETVTDNIYNSLAPGELYYYDKNFDSVTKELMKKIKLPISPREFSLNLKMLLSDNKHKNSIEVVKNVIAASAVPPVGIIGPITRRVAIRTAPPAPTAPPAALSQFTVADYPQSVENAIALYPQALQTEINTFLSLPAVPKTPQQKQDVSNIQEAIAILAYDNNLTEDELADILHHPGKKAKKITTKEKIYARQLLDHAARMKLANPPAPAPQPATPIKGFNLLPYKEKLRDLVEAEINNMGGFVDPTMKQQLIDHYKSEIITEEFRNEVQRREAALGQQLSKDGIDDVMKDIESQFQGFGIKQSRLIKYKKEIHKYAIDLKKLSKNILALKYVKNANNVATFKPIEISQPLKQLIQSKVLKQQKISPKEFQALSVTEQRVVKRLYSFLKIDFDHAHSDDFQTKFEVMYGSFLAGNNNADLKKQLKEYVKLALHEAIITKEESQRMLDKLSH